MPESPAERHAHAQIAALSRIAREPSGAKMTQKAREAFIQRFYDETDPSLPEDERRRQAEAARRLFYVRLSKKAAAARRRIREATDELADLEQAMGGRDDAA